MEDRDARLAEIQELVDQNFEEIGSTIDSAATKVGTTMTSSMKNMWSTPISKISSIESHIANQDTDLAAIKQSIEAIDPTLKGFLDNYNINLKNVIDAQDGKIASIETAINSLNTNLGGNNPDNLIAKVGSQLTTLDEIKQALESLGIPNASEIASAVYNAINGDKVRETVGNVGQAIGNSITGIISTPRTRTNGSITNGATANGTTNPTRNISGTSSSSGSFFIAKKYTGNKSQLNIENSIVDRLRYFDFDDSLTSRAKYYEAMGLGSKNSYNGSASMNIKMLDWMKKNGYASGARRILDDQLAWTQEKGLEAIIRPSDGAILTPLSRGDSVLNAGATQNIWDMANNPMKFIKDNLTLPINLSPALSGGNYDIQQSMVITLPNVQNYSEFVTALQNDKRFEKMVQDMTVNQLSQKNALAKYKYKY